MSFFHRNRWAAPFALLAPGVLWLAIFFVLPFAYLGYQSLQSGIYPSFEFTWEFSNFTEAVSDNREQLVRSFVYAGIATVIAFLFSYPLAYWIAFRAGREVHAARHVDDLDAVEVETFGARRVLVRARAVGVDRDRVG